MHFLHKLRCFTCSMSWCHVVHHTQLKFITLRTLFVCCSYCLWAG